MRWFFLLVALVCFISSPAFAAEDPPALAEALFPPVKGALNTPGAPGKTFTEYGDMKAWLDGYAGEPGLTVVSLGKSQNNRDIWAVRLTGGEPKLRMMVFARVHGNEPASSEATLQFIHELTRGSLKNERRQAEFLIIPVSNPDGSVDMKRLTASGIDINRDYTTTHQVETRILSKEFREFDPHLLVDMHEYTVWGRLGDRSSPYDLLVAAPNEPNIPGALVEHADMYFAEVVKALADKGMRGGLYELLSLDKKTGTLKVSESATTFVSAKNFLGMPGRVSFIFEVRGIGLGNQHYERRTLAGVTALTAVLRTGIANADQTLTVLDRTRKEILAATRWELARTSVTRERTYPLADAQSNTIKDVPAIFTDRTGGTSGATVAVPAAYIIPAGRKDLIEPLERMGVTWDTLKADAELEVEVQTIDSVEPDGNLYKGYPKQKVTTSVKKDRRAFKKGDYVISTAQRNRLYLQVLEAASPSGFATLRVLGEQPGAEVPVYRVLTMRQAGSM